MSRRRLYAVLYLPKPGHDSSHMRVVFNASPCRAKPVCIPQFGPSWQDVALALLFFLT